SITSNIFIVKLIFASFGNKRTKIKPPISERLYSQGMTRPFNGMTVLKRRPNRCNAVIVSQKISE
ncbi:hypothetical protein, partial [Vibrio parahaemolyticus]|uniref:hypothetical protein n=1 Tax=Vibrio parahaemolyticus TaxID=670 RepID=UPI0022A893CE